MIKAGAAGYVTKDRAPEVLLSAIRKVIHGGRYVSESLAEQLLVQLTTDTSQPAHEALSAREYQVVRMIAAGRTLKEVGAELSLSIRTASTYRARALDKLNLKTNAELIRYALQNKLVD